MATQLSKKRKFVANGVFFAGLNEVLTRELAEDGYSGVKVRVTPMRTEIIIRATRTHNFLANAISAINAGDLNAKPLVQVLEIRPIGVQRRYRLLISDGVLTHDAMLASQLNELVTTGINVLINVY